MWDLISVIIPVYNSALYIQECVKSVLAQTYSCFEVLLIDDGSEDDSRVICKALCEEDDRLRLIVQPHKGVSAARNAGIRAAKGKYVFFLDSDDAIHPQLLENLYRLQEENQTIIAAEGYCRLSDEEFQKQDYWKTGDQCTDVDTYLDSEKAREYRFFGINETMFCAIGGKMIDRNAVKDMGFREDISHGEDTLFMYQLISGGANASVWNHNWYYYRTHEGGATTVFSVASCRNRQAVNRYIRDEEIKCGRVSNAVGWENAMLASIMRWYTIGQKTKDRELKKYARQVADEERRSELFYRLPSKRRREFLFTLYWYPILRSLPVLSWIWCGWRWIWSKLQNIIWIKKWNLEWKWKRARNWMRKTIKDFFWKWVQRPAIRLKWIIKGRITWSKWMARELWAKAWRIRNKVWWAWVWIEKTFIQPWKKLKKHFTD